MGSQAKAYEVNNNPLLSLVVIAALSSLAYWMVVVDRTPPETRIDGAVVNPGSYQLGPNPTPLEVLRAGGGVVPGARFKFDVLDDVLQQLPSHYVHINSVAESPLSEIETRRIDWIIPEALQNRLAIGSAHHLAYGSANDFGTFYLLQQLEEDDLATLRQHLVKGGFRRMDRTDIDKRERWFKVLVGAYPKPHLLVVRIENDHALEMFFSHQVSWSDKFFLIGSSRKETPEKLLVTLAGQPIRSPVTKEYVDRLIDEMGVDQGVIDIAVGKFLAGMVTNSGVPFYGRTSRCRFRPH